MADEPENTIKADGIWRPEEWRGRWLVARIVPVSEGSVAGKREILNTSKFGAEAQIFESEESAQQAADRQNAEEEEKD